MAKLYRLDDEVINNICFFLDKVSFEGLKEVGAAQTIIACLSNPVEEVENEE